MAAAVDIIDGLIYSHAGGHPRYADVYVPQDRAGPLAVILWLHGGGWKFGDRKLGPDLSRFFAQSGFVMCSIDYRLSDESLFPAQVEDVKSAVRWLRSVAAQYGLDRDRIGLWGSSSGGHLAVLAGVSGPGSFETSEHAGYSSEVKAVVDGYGPINFALIDEQRSDLALLQDNAESVRIGQLKPSSDPESFESLLLGAPIMTCPERVRTANPVTYVKPGSPPVLILHGTRDAAIPAQQSTLLFEALAGAGNDVTLCLIEGLGHGFLNKNDWDQGTRHMQVRSTSDFNPGDYASMHMIEEFFRMHL